MPEASWGRHTRWLTCMTIEPSTAGCTREDVRLALEREGIEARPLWKPMHLQPVFDQAPCYNANVSARLFDMGLCLPSGTGMSAAERDEVIAIVRAAMLDGTPVTGRPRAVPGRVLLDAEQVVERVGADCA
jgi:pyridoxal phosphate-dependent aminotransferase EpsN